MNQPLGGESSIALHLEDQPVLGDLIIAILDYNVVWNHFDTDFHMPVKFGICTKTIKHNNKRNCMHKPVI